MYEKRWLNLKYLQMLFFFVKVKPQTNTIARALHTTRNYINLGLPLLQLRRLNWCQRYISRIRLCSHCLVLHQRKAEKMNGFNCSYIKILWVVIVVVRNKLKKYGTYDVDLGLAVQFVDEIDTRKWKRFTHPFLTKVSVSKYELLPS